VGASLSGRETRAGAWRENTLVVDMTNFKRETSLPDSSVNTHLVERFTRNDANTLVYEFTVEDPTMWTRPWTAGVPMRKSEDPSRSGLPRLRLGPSRAWLKVKNPTVRQ
jgi:hypothetical protein